MATTRKLPRLPGVPCERAEIVIPGRVPGKKRHRSGVSKRTGRTTTWADPLGVIDEEVIVLAWHQAGRPTVGDGPVVLDLVTFEHRPKDHYLSDRRTLSAEGQRMPFPLRKPDIDNRQKLVMDALQTLAFGDDARVVDGRTRKLWSRFPEDQEYAILTLSRAVPS